MQFLKHLQLLDWCPNPVLEGLRLAEFSDQAGKKESLALFFSATGNKSVISVIGLILHTTSPPTLLNTWCCQVSPASTPRHDCLLVALITSHSFHFFSQRLSPALANVTHGPRKSRKRDAFVNWNCFAEPCRSFLFFFFPSGIKSRKWINIKRRSLPTWSSECNPISIHFVVMAHPWPALEGGRRISRVFTAVL